MWPRIGPLPLPLHTSPEPFNPASLSSPSMPSSKAQKNNSLTIRLTESAVFLRNDGEPSRGSPDSSETRSSLLRGLLVLDLVKPTKITSIDVELTATTRTAWPEGIGSRRIEVTEEHKIFNASTTYFRASKAASSRRTLSIGPGISYNQLAEDDLEEIDRNWERHARPRARYDEQALGARVALSSVSRSNSGSSPHGAFHSQNPEPNTAPPHAGPSRRAYLQTNTPPRTNQRFSIDSSYFQRTPLHESYNEHDDNDRGTLEHNLALLAPIPPYSPFSTSQGSSLTLNRGRRLSVGDVSFSSATTDTNHAAQSLEEYRNSLHGSLNQYQEHSHSPPPTGSSLSLHSIREQANNLNHHSNMSDIIPEDEQVPAGLSAITNLGVTRQHSVPPPSAPPLTPQSSRSQTQSPAPHYRSVNGQTISNVGQEQLSHSQTRGRRGSRSRFAFTAVSNALKEAVRSTSSSRGSILPQSKERYDESARDRSQTSRGRTMDRPILDLSLQEDPGTDEHKPRKESKERGATGVIGRLLGEKDGGEWKEFKKGTYTYPISFSIPGNAPPTMSCEFGSVIWKLKASAHRPGAFKAKMTAVREVVIISCPTEEDTEDTENIIVERHWDGQLQYLISISGRSFYIGGTLPVTLTMMPLAKVMIHRISVSVEERVDYYTNMTRVARSDPVNRFSLLSIRNEGKGADPVLPLQSDDPEAFRNSPLFQILGPDEDISEKASSLMGPGPWSFHTELKLPSSCDVLKFTNRNRQSNILVSHTLKLVMRVERGDDLHVDGKTGKRKLFDIVVQTPVLILSCRCNPEWTSLPRYSETFDDVGNITPSCPCQGGRQHGSGIRPNLTAALERITSRHSTDSNASAAETSPIQPASMPSLRQATYNEAILTSNSLFERLMSGQETETGETPPAYDAGGPSRLNGIAVQS